MTSWKSSSSYLVNHVFMWEAVWISPVKCRAALYTRLWLSYSIDSVVPQLVIRTVMYISRRRVHTHEKVPNTIATRSLQRFFSHTLIFFSLFLFFNCHACFQVPSPSLSLACWRVQTMWKSGRFEGDLEYFCKLEVKWWVFTFRGRVTTLNFHPFQLQSYGGHAIESFVKGEAVSHHVV